VKKNDSCSTTPNIIIIDMHGNQYTIDNNDDIIPYDDDNDDVTIQATHAKSK